MPVRSAGEQPARPTPGAATAPSSRQHRPQSPTRLLQIPEVLPQRTCPCKEAEVRVCVLYPPVRRVQSPLLQVRLCERLPLCLSALSGTSHSTQPPRSLQLYSTQTAWETQTQRGKRGGERGGEEGVT